MTFSQRKALVRSYLGKEVTITIDRPIGYVHQKENYTLHYPINYGYLPGVLGGDGEELDVYLMGVTEPKTTYTAQIIGIVYRENDTEDKLIAAPSGSCFNQAEIAQAIHFQEQYYKTSIEALYQKSCGVILYRKKTDAKEYLLLLQTYSRTWSFPKGHMEMGETEAQTAIREAWEETGVKVKALDDFRIETSYVLDSKIHKSVILYAAEMGEEEPILNESEIARYKFVDAQEAKRLLHPDYAPIIDKIEKEL